MAKKIILKEKWVREYAQITNIEESILIRLFELDALNVSSIKSILIKHEFSVILDTTLLNKTQAKMTIAKKYETSTSHVESVLYNKVPVDKMKKCTICESQMTRYKYTRNKGICDQCVIENPHLR